MKNMKTKISKMVFEREAGTLFGTNAERLDVLAANVANHNLTLTFSCWRCLRQMAWRVSFWVLVLVS